MNLSFCSTENFWCKLTSHTFQLSCPKTHKPQLTKDTGHSSQNTQATAGCVTYPLCFVLNSRCWCSLPGLLYGWAHCLWFLLKEKTGCQWQHPLDSQWGTSDQQTGLVSGSKWPPKYKPSSALPGRAFWMLVDLVSLQRSRMTLLVSVYFRKIVQVTLSVEKQQT